MKLRQDNLTFLTTIIVGFFSILFSGCLGIGGGKVEPMLYYTLEAVPAVEGVEPGESGDIIIGLGKVELPDYLDRKEIVVRTRHNELRYTANHLWAERPGDSLPRVLAQNIERQMNTAAHVYALPWPDTVEPQLTVLVNVHAFEGEQSPGSQVLFDFSWGIQSIPDGNMLKQGNYRSTNLGWDSGDYSDLANGLSDELAMVGRLIGSDLATVYETFVK